MKYTGIKRILNTQIKESIKSLWTWKDNNFTMIYKAYEETDRIYTPIQLLEEIDKTIKENGKAEQKIIEIKQMKVYKSLKSLGRATNRMLANDLKWDINRVTGRVTELVKLNLVTSNDTYKDRETNRTVTLWKCV